MGKRSRRRGDAVSAVAPAPSAPAPGRAGTGSPRRRGGRPAIEDRPKPPWHPVPLVEICVLVGLVLLVLGMALGSLGGLDTALREHLAGYRSHTTVIASLPAVTTAAVLYFARVPWTVLVIAAVAVFAGVFWWMRRVFMRRASRARRARG